METQPTCGEGDMPAKVPTNHRPSTLFIQHPSYTQLSSVWSNGSCSLQAGAAVAPGQARQHLDQLQAQQHNQHLPAHQHNQPRPISRTLDADSAGPPTQTASSRWHKVHNTGHPCLTGPPGDNSSKHQTLPAGLKTTHNLTSHTDTAPKVSLTDRHMP
jgi:hypothetical protein